MKQYRMMRTDNLNWVLQKLTFAHTATRGRGAGNLIPAKWGTNRYQMNLPHLAEEFLKVETSEGTATLDDIVEAISQAEKEILEKLEEMTNG